VPARRLVTLCALLGALLALPAAAGAYPTTFLPVAHNPADSLVSRPIDDFRYDHAKRCGKGPQRGTLSLQHWLERHSLGVSWGIMRCEKLGPHDYSLHADGRALDWHLDVHDPRDREEAQRLIDLLLAPDGAGNVHALARRMGVQEIIWDCKGWFSSDGGMEPYSVCLNKHGEPRHHVDETLAHRNHIHFGLNWAGAHKQTSFWRAAAAGLVH
jgi:hypothetical protein